MLFSIDGLWSMLLFLKIILFFLHIPTTIHSLSRLKLENAFVFLVSEIEQLHTCLLQRLSCKWPLRFIKSKIVTWRDLRFGLELLLGLRRIQNGVVSCEDRLQVGIVVHKVGFAWFESFDLLDFLIVDLIFYII